MSSVSAEDPWGLWGVICPLTVWGRPCVLSERKQKQNQSYNPGPGSEGNTSHCALQGLRRNEVFWFHCLRSGQFISLSDRGKLATATKLGFGSKTGKIVISVHLQNGIASDQVFSLLWVPISWPSHLQLEVMVKNENGRPYTWGSSTSKA